jgi:hypothetical protein
MALKLGAGTSQLGFQPYNAERSEQFRAGIAG